MQKKKTKKIISFIILIASIFINIATFWSYSILISLTLMDQNNLIYAIFMKLFFIDMKKTGKKQKKRN